MHESTIDRCFSVSYSPELTPARWVCALWFGGLVLRHKKTTIQGWRIGSQRWLKYFGHTDVLTLLGHQPFRPRPIEPSAAMPSSLWELVPSRARVPRRAPVEGDTHDGSAWGSRGKTNSVDLLVRVA